jgi:hypothetical protein
VRLVLPLPKGKKHLTSKEEGLQEAEQTGLAESSPAYYHSSDQGSFCPIIFYPDCLLFIKLNIKIHRGATVYLGPSYEDFHVT